MLQEINGSKSERKWVDYRFASFSRFAFMLCFGDSIILWSASLFLPSLLNACDAVATSNFWEWFQSCSEHTWPWAQKFRIRRSELQIEFSTLEIDNFFQVMERKGALQTAGTDLVRDFSRSNGLTVKHESFRELMQIFIGLYKWIVESRIWFQVI